MFKMRSLTQLIALLICLNGFVKALAQVPCKDVHLNGSYGFNTFEYQMSEYNELLRLGVFTFSPTHAADKVQAKFKDESKKLSLLLLLSDNPQGIPELIWTLKKMTKNIKGATLETNNGMCTIKIPYANEDIQLQVLKKVSIAKGDLYIIQADDIEDPLSLVQVSPGKPSTEISPTEPPTIPNIELKDMTSSSYCTDFVKGKKSRKRCQTAVESAKYIDERAIYACSQIVAGALPFVRIKCLKGILDKIYTPEVIKQCLRDDSARCLKKKGQ